MQRFSDYNMDLKNTERKQTNLCINISISILYVVYLRSSQRLVFYKNEATFISKYREIEPENSNDIFKATVKI